jgi:hypothetical protein
VSDLIGALISVKNAFTLVAFLSVVALLAFRTSQFVSLLQLEAVSALVERREPRAEQARADTKDSKVGQAPIR